MNKLDVKDRKMLYYLSRNGRIPNNQLAKLIGVSKNSVAYRIDRLKKAGIIKHFSAVINLGSLHLSTFTILIKFNDDIYQNPKIIDFFKNHPYANWMITLSGQWDLFVELVAKDLRHFQNIVEGIKNEFQTQLNSYKIMFSQDTLRVEHLIKNVYEDLKLEEIPPEKRTKNKHKIDAKDKEILALLTKDSSLHYLEIAKQTNLTMDIVRYRMKKMLDNRIIIKFFPEINLKNLGFTEYLFKINLKNVSSEKMNSLRTQIRNNSNITYAFFDTNELNLVFVCAFKDSEGIDQLSRQLRKDFGEIINEQEYILIKEQALFNLFPHGLKE